MNHLTATPDPDLRPRVAVIVPASNEAALIGPCLDALRASDDVAGGVEIAVIANGCRDATAERARGFAPAFAARGWSLTVIERAEGGKLPALNAGDAAVSAPIRVYLDADVIVDPPLLAALEQALDGPQPRYASGSLRMIAPRNWVSRAYARIWARVPFMVTDVPGCGLFAVNAAGRARWGAFPDIVSDDTFVRLNFAPEERVTVPVPYRWPIVEGWGALVRVRRRQDRGVAEIAARYPELLANDNKPPFPMARKARMALSDPVGFAVYSGVALAVRLSPSRRAEWSRGR